MAFYKVLTSFQSYNKTAQQHKKSTYKLLVMGLDLIKVMTGSIFLTHCYNNIEACCKHDNITHIYCILSFQNNWCSLINECLTYMLHLFEIIINFLILTPNTYSSFNLFSIYFLMPILK